MPLGAHLPTSKGFEAALARARELGCDCLQIFSKSPRQWDAAPLDAAKTQAFREAWRRSGFFPLVAHDSYLINLAAPDGSIRARSIGAMIDEVGRADALGCDFLVTHCGAHLQKTAKPRAVKSETHKNARASSLFNAMEIRDSQNDTPQNHECETASFDAQAKSAKAFSEGETAGGETAGGETAGGETAGGETAGGETAGGETAGLQRLVESLREVLAATPDARVRIALENTAGQGTCLGGPFEHLAFVLGELQSPRLCVCFDTCHAFAAGHDVSTARGLEDTLRHFNATIGLEHLALIHFNDSKGDLGGHLDRHEHIGQGAIGSEMKGILNHALLRNLPFILETPDVETMIGANLDAVRAMKSKAE